MGIEHLPVARFREADLVPSEMVSGLMDEVHDFFLGFEYESVDSLPDGRGDLVVLVDKVDRRSKLERLARHEGRVLLVAAPSDRPFWAEFLPEGKVPPNFVAAFVTNNDLADPRIVNVPVGIRREMVDLCLRAKSGGGPRDRLLLANFNVKPTIYRADGNGRPHIRRRLAERFSGEPWATVDVAEGARKTEAELAAYYASILRHRFVLSPEGLGADCYRHWECLYLGAVPIIRRSTAMESFSELPILFTDDYSEIDEDYLEEQWGRFQQHRFQFRALRKSFHRERFLESVAQLSEPRFLSWGFTSPTPAPPIA